jgi:hypothetical protein
MEEERERTSMDHDLETPEDPLLREEESDRSDGVYAEPDEVDPTP